MTTSAVPSTTVPIPTFVTGDRVVYGKQRGTYLCGNGTICTIELDKGGFTPYIPLEKLKRIRERKSKDNLLIWTDPVTGAEHTCPKDFPARLKAHLLKGKENAQTAEALLKAMGQPVTEGNKRVLRKAALYMKQHGIHVIAARSSEGGYFIAATQDEVNEYVEDQRRFAQSMLDEAENLAANQCRIFAGRVRRVGGSMILQSVRGDRVTSDCDCSLTRMNTGRESLPKRFPDVRATVVRIARRLFLT